MRQTEESKRKKKILDFTALKPFSQFSDKKGRIIPWI